MFSKFKHIYCFLLIAMMVMGIIAPVMVRCGLV